MTSITFQAMKNCKDDSRKTSKVTLEIATSVENTAVTAHHHRGEETDLVASVNAGLGATKEYALRYLCYVVFCVILCSVSSFNAQASCSTLLGRVPSLVASRKA